MRLRLANRWKDPLFWWYEPSEATALRQLSNARLAHGPLFLEDETGRRLNWAALIGLGSFILFHLRPWDWHMAPENIFGLILLIVVAYLLLAKIKAPERLVKLLSKEVYGGKKRQHPVVTALRKDIIGKSRDTGKSALIALFPTGIRIGTSFMPWRLISRYRLTDHPEIPLRGLELRLRSSLSGDTKVFIGIDPTTTDEREVIRRLYDLHPLAYWENVGAV